MMGLTGYSKMTKQKLSDYIKYVESSVEEDLQKEQPPPIVVLRVNKM